MKSISINIEEKIDQEDFFKTISFISPDILEASINSGVLEMQVSDKVDELFLVDKLKKLQKKYTYGNQKEEIYYKNEKKCEEYFEIKRDNKNVVFFENGQIGFGDKGNFLLEYLDRAFLTVAKKLNAIEKAYPVLLPMEGYVKTGYIKKSPQYAIFCGTINETIEDLEKTSVEIYKKQVNKIINEPEYALSPSACFHTYIEYQDKELPENMVVSFRQNVFRNEGKFNYREIGRLRDYQVREIVLIGNNRFVIEMRDKIMEATVDLMNTLGLKGDISLANDSFIVPKMQMYKKIQRIDKSKYEMHLYVSDKKKISTASFNLHGKAFTSNFNISVKGVEDTVTGCVGFGLQRWIIAFVAQYGWNEERWPEIVKEAYALYRKERL